jgi:hypothetical protein
MELTETQQEILFNAWVLAREGKGQVLEPWAHPDAHDLAEHGWLERRFQPDGELAWFWTAEAEHAVDVNALMESAKGRQN